METSPGVWLRKNLEDNSRELLYISMSISEIFKLTLQTIEAEKLAQNYLQFYE